MKVSQTTQVGDRKFNFCIVDRRNQVPEIIVYINEILYQFPGGFKKRNFSETQRSLILHCIMEAEALGENFRKTFIKITTRHCK